MNNIKSLFPNMPEAEVPPPDPALIQLLENMVQEAKEGRINSIIALTFGSSGYMKRVRFLPANASYYTIRGALDWLKDDFVKSQE